MAKVRKCDIAAFIGIRRIVCAHSRRLVQEHSSYATLYREGHRYYARGDGWDRIIREYRIAVSDSISTKII